MLSWRGIVHRGVAAADNLCAAMSSGMLPECGSLVTVLFHAIYRDAAQLDDASLAPNQNVTLEDLRRFLGEMLEGGYVPVTDGQVADGLAPGRNHLLVTFDDGYFNNAQVLPVLEQAGVPATFYVSTSHVLEGKAFWWDVLAREMRQRGAAERAINAEIRRMKIWSNDRIEASLKLRFGERALRPRGDLDRPLAASELRDMARHPLVSVGNHTCDHAILPNCTPAERRRQIGDCQIALAAITGKAPTSIAYPNGDYSREVVEDAQAAGLRVGVTVRPCTTHLPLAAGKASMTLGRYLVWGDEDLRVQRRKMAASFVPGNLLRTLMLSAY